MKHTSLWKTFICVCGAAFWLATAASAGGLSQKLADVEHQYKDGADMKQIETACLGLLKDYSSNEDKGEIYAEIPTLYLTSFGRTTEKTQRAALPVDSVIAYCQKALAYPLDPEIVVKMYFSWGLMESHKVVPRVDFPGFAKVRRPAVIAYLKGYKFLLDKNLPETRPTLDSIGERPSDTTEYANWYARAVALKQTTQLVIWRDLIQRSINSLYGYREDDVPEMKGLIFSVLGKTEIADKLVASLQTRINKRLEQ